MGLFQWDSAETTLNTDKILTGLDKMAIITVSSRGKENVGIYVFQHSKLRHKLSRWLSLTSLHSDFDKCRAPLQCQLLGRSLIRQQCPAFLLCGYFCAHVTCYIAPSFPSLPHLYRDTELLGVHHWEFLFFLRSFWVSSSHRLKNLGAFPVTQAAEKKRLSDWVKKRLKSMPGF